MTNDPNLLYVALESSGSILKQTLRMLNKGTKYWVYFIAATSKGDEALLSVSVGSEEYIAGVSFATDVFSKQYFAFVATRDDGMAILQFRNTAPAKHFAKPRVFLGDVRVSDAPHCYAKYQAQAKCINSDPKEMFKFKNENETSCRASCERHRCSFMLFDPVTVEGYSYCEIYPDCATMAMYYGGSSGTLFKRQPCVAGGVMSPEAAITYHLPGAGENGDGGVRPGFNGPMTGQNKSNSSHLLNPLVGNKWTARDEMSHEGDDSFGSKENTAGKKGGVGAGR